tara:strand:- start:46541 stop:47047 length:507 start_codon:yes stop_codon:yes gene_type:complete
VLINLVVTYNRTIFVFLNVKVLLNMKNSKQEIIKSLDLVGEIFPDIKEACVEGYYKIDTERLSGIEEILRCIKLYVILKDIQKLSGRKLEVLSYYLKFGYSKKTKKDIIKNIKITDSNLNNINHELRRMGVINSVGYNQSSNEVSAELLEFTRFIVDEKRNYVLIKIN